MVKAMLELLWAPWALAAGFGLGLLFYGGLWWTVRHLADFRRPALMLLGGALLRMGAVLGGLYAVAGGEWSRLLLGLLGFLVARLAVTWATRLPPSPSKREAHHAP